MRIFVSWFVLNITFSTRATCSLSAGTSSALASTAFSQHGQFSETASNIGMTSYALMSSDSFYYNDSSPVVFDHSAVYNTSVPSAVDGAYTYDVPPTDEAPYPSMPAISCVDPSLIFSGAPMYTMDGQPYTPSGSFGSNPSVSLPQLSPQAGPSSELITSSRRNVQVSRTAVRAVASSPLNRWQCPYCPHVQKNRRSPDFKRHVETHTRPADALWVCCGVPLANAAEHCVPDAVARDEVWEFEGMLMVGGCRKTFSRRDAYGRHLKREKGRCWGDPQAMYQPGNRADLGEC